MYKFIIIFVAILSLASVFSGCASAPLPPIMNENGDFDVGRYEHDDDVYYGGLGEGKSIEEARFRSEQQALRAVADECGIVNKDMKASESKVKKVYSGWMVMSRFKVNKDECEENNKLMRKVASETSLRQSANQSLYEGVFRDNVLGRPQPVSTPVDKEPDEYKDQSFEFSKPKSHPIDVSGAVLRCYGEISTLREHIVALSAKYEGDLSNPALAKLTNQLEEKKVVCNRLRQNSNTLRGETTMDDDGHPLSEAPDPDEAE